MSSVGSFPETDARARIAPRLASRNASGHGWFEARLTGAHLVVLTVTTGCLIAGVSLHWRVRNGFHEDWNRVVQVHLRKGDNPGASQAVPNDPTS